MLKNTEKINPYKVTPLKRKERIKNIDIELENWEKFKN